MTTGFGFISEKGREGLLVSDRQASSSNGGYKRPCEKLQINYDANFAFMSAGRVDEGHCNLVSKLMKGNVDVERIVKTGKFNELKNLNLKRWDGRLPNFEEMSSFLFLTNFGNTRQLYTAWPLGKVEKRITTWIGSGAEQVDAYMKAKNIQMYAETGISLLGNDNVSSEQGRILAYHGLKLATKHDMYSSGIDMVVMNEDGTRNVGREFVELEKKFDKTILKAIMKD